MRLEIIFKHDKLDLPIHYNEIVQGFIYNHISEDLSKWLHDEGFAYEKRSFKFFTFSRIMGQFKKLDWLSIVNFQLTIEN